MFFFFFSSRRRHTRLQGDWSSDVCSSDLRFGAEGERGVVWQPDGSLGMVNVDEVGEDALAVHDAERHDPSLAFALAHLAERPTGPTPVGVFRSVNRPVYAEGLHAE